MNEMVERVAHAIHNAEWSVDFDKMPPDSIQVACARRQAEAAIAAMRELIEEWINDPPSPPPVTKT